MPAVLRAATMRDAPEIVRVIRSSRIRFMPYALPVHSEAEDLRWVGNSLLASGIVTVACVEGDVIGVSAVRNAEDAGWIDQLYVEPDHCGRGIGSQLLASALASLRRPVRLYTFQQNQRARAFYELHGFRPVKFGDGSTNEERCPDVLYELGGGRDGREPRP